jgi:hypothetical protein
VQAVGYPLQEQFNKQIQLYIFLQTEPVSRETDPMPISLWLSYLWDNCFTFLKVCQESTRYG